MKDKIALIASLDTKLEETLYAKKEIERCGMQAVLIDVSTRFPVDREANISSGEILKYSGIGWEEFEPYGKAESIETMSKALAKALPILYEEKKFDAVISIGGGQNARMAAFAMKKVPFGVPKIVASSLACGKRTMEQYVGDKDIFVLHTVADISGLNYITKSIILNVVHSAVGMLEYAEKIPKSSKYKIAATMLGITTKGVEGVLKYLSDDLFEKTCFHANGVGGRCMESLIRAEQFDFVLDMTLHEITGEVLGGYCSGSTGRLMAAIEKEIPMVVVPGALDMLDFFIDEEGNGLPPDIEERKKVYHNSSIVHTKVKKEEAIKLAEVLANRLNLAVAPVTLVLPDEGFCEAAAKGGPMFDEEVDSVFINRICSLLKPEVKVIHVHGNINSEACQKIVADCILSKLGVKEVA